MLMPQSCCQTHSLSLAFSIDTQDEESSGTLECVYVSCSFSFRVTSLVSHSSEMSRESLLSSVTPINA